MVKFLRSRKIKIFAGIVIVLVLATIAVVVALFALRPRTKSIPLTQPPKFISTILGGETDQKQPFNSPFGVAALPGRLFVPAKIFVADTGNGRIQIFTSDGKFLSSFSISPPYKPKRKQPPLPIGVAVDDQANIYVSEAHTPYLFVFDSDGKFLNTFPKSKRPVLKKPVGLAFSRDKLYVTDIGDHKVKVFDKQGRLLLQFGGQFLFPVGVALDKDGRIYVADTGNTRVQVLGSKGKLLTSTDRFSAVSLNLPRGVAIDPWGRIHIVDTSGNRILVFSKKFKYLFSYGKAGTGKGELGYPNGIAIDEHSGQISITEQINNRISIWGYPN